MKKLLWLTSILLMFSCFVSCDNDEDMNTDIEIIERQLQDFVNDNEIQKCSIIVMYGEKMSTDRNDVYFTISNGFVEVKEYGNKYSYNLLYLSKYKMDSHKNLMLYFTNTHY
jgi:hypothetical protein